MDYFKSLITSYQEMNNIPTNTVRIVKLNDSQFVHISRLFARDNYFQGFDLLQAINNYISQVNGPIYHMQVVYRDDGHGQYLEKIYLEFSLADYEQLNVALKQVLEPTQYWLLTKKLTSRSPSSSPFSQRGVIDALRHASCTLRRGQSLP